MSDNAPIRAGGAGGAGVVKPGDDPGPRQDYLKDSDYFMAVALLTAKRSRDPNTQVGACIVNQENQIVGIGHNIMPNGCDGQLSWKGSPKNSTDKGDLCRKSDDQRKESDVQWFGTKYPYVCHAERHAIMNKNCADLKGCTMYVTLFPCNECTKLIIQAGIKEVVYRSDQDGNSTEMRASERLLRTAGITFTVWEIRSPSIFHEMTAGSRHLRTLFLLEL